MTRNLALLSLLLLSLAACGPASADAGDPADPLLVAAASDLQFAFGEIARLYEEETGRPVRVTFGSTGNLTAQIENGAPYDVLAAANVAYVEQLDEQGLIVSGTKQLYARGRLALVVNRQSGLHVSRLDDLRDAAVRRVAIANPEHAPYGLAAQQALQSAGVWDAVRDRLVLGENVSQTLQFVQTGDAPVGIVALSIADVPEVQGALLDEDLHDPIDQVMAVIQGSPREDAARDFVRFVNGPVGQEIMVQYGFVLPGESD
ncbi:MAG TPA: molybdate ABC transporter substrate-binding protein [Candidatus Sulfomarinibacteraceae bacterium]|nr:molybdate ABC transporter substrate-binding protein [Candidatus Sulfomarinibacteraceae bacterium]